MVFSFPYEDKNKCLPQKTCLIGSAGYHLFVLFVIGPLALHITACGVGGNDSHGKVTITHKP